MRLLIILFALIVSKCSYSQGEYDSLQKYSYPVVCISEKTPEGTYKILSNGSGFFIHYNKKLFFATAYHVFTGYDADSEKIVLPIKIIGIKINNRYIFIQTGRDFVYESDESKLIAPDAWVINFDSSLLHKGESVYEISSFIDPSFFNINPKIGICFGYTIDSIDRKKILHNDIIGSYDTIRLTSTKYSTPKQVLIATRGSLIYRICRLPLRHGMSGAPVFGDYILQTKHHIKFIGIASAGNPDSIKIQSYIARDSFIWKLLEASKK